MERHRPALGAAHRRRDAHRPGPRRRPRAPGARRRLNFEVHTTTRRRRMSIPTARRVLLMALSLLIAGLTLAACGSDDNSGSSGGSSTAASTAASGSSGKSGKIALLLPESKTTRY